MFGGDSNELSVLGAERSATESACCLFDCAGGKLCRHCCGQDWECERRSHRIIKFASTWFLCWPEPTRGSV